MDKQQELSALVEDLQFVKKAIAKSGNIMRYIDVSGGLALVGLWGGIFTIIIAAAAYLLSSRYGTYGDAPTAYRVGIYLLIAATLAIAGLSKLRLFLGKARKLDRNITVDKLFDEIYTTQLLNILIPFITAIAVLLIFLITRELTIYIVPTLSILVGLLCVSYLNIFQLRELVVVGDWLVATGLIALFTAEAVHPLLAVIYTFGVGFTTTYFAYKLMRK
ncbi:MAG: hypothetical protein FH749_06230 [Firmicutes bacterium]|nr:hypothetical protein [Bacillota bacterium]